MKKDDKNNKKKVKSRKIQVSSGFTLIELLATIAILSVIMSVVIYFAMNVVSSAKGNSYQVTINNVQSQANNYVMEEISAMTWIPLPSSTNQYQCVTVQKLIDAGYFNGDVLESMVAENQPLLASDYVYLERNKTTKTITKNVLLTDSRYRALCSAISTSGRIDIDVEPWGWVKDRKVITVDYRIYNYDKVDNYVYDYVFENDVGTVKAKIEETTFTTSFVSIDDIEISENGTLCASIKNKSDGTLLTPIIKCLEISEFDNTGPIGTILSTNNVTSSQTVTLVMTDSQSGVSEYYFGKDDPDTTTIRWTDVTDAARVTETVDVDSEGRYYLVAKDAVGNIGDVVTVDFYKTILSISNGSVTPSVILTKYGNKFTIPKGNGDPYYTFNGWYTNSRFTGSSIKEYSPVANSYYSNTLYGKTTENRLTGGVVKITGKYYYGEQLTATIITHTTPKADNYAYQWYVSDTKSTSGGNIISGATSRYLTLEKEYIDKYIYVVVTATKDNYRSTTFATVTNDSIKRRPITVLAGTSSKEYDGTALTNSSCSVVGDVSLLRGHSISCTMTSGSRITDVGSVNNVIDTVTIKNTSSVDYSVYYDIVKSNGKLNVTKKSCACSITDYSKSMEYPVSPSGSISYSCTGDGTLYVNSSNTDVITVGTIGSSVANLTAKNYGSSVITVGRTSGDNYDSCYATQTIKVASDTTAPTITFNPNGSGGKWIKTASSTISVSDSGSGVDSNSLKYVFSKSKTFDLTKTATGGTVTSGESVEDVIAYFVNDSTYKLSGKDGIYYLHAYACDKEGNCTSKVSAQFKLDNTPPVIACNVGNKIDIEHYKLDEYYDLVYNSDGTKKIAHTQTIEILYDSSSSKCYGYHQLLLQRTQASHVPTCTDAYTYSDENGVDRTSCSSQHYDDDGNTYCTGPVTKEDGSVVYESCIRKATACNCIHDDIGEYCTVEMTFTVYDEAGNFASDKFINYVRYEDPKNSNSYYRDKYCTSDRQPKNSEIVEGK